MAKTEIMDAAAVLCFAVAVSCIDIGKETAKAFLTGGVVVWWIMSKKQD